MLDIEALLMPRRLTEKEDINREENASVEKCIPADDRLGLDAFITAAVYCEVPTRVPPCNYHTRTANPLGLEAFLSAAVHCEESTKVSWDATWNENQLHSYRPPGALSRLLTSRFASVVQPGLLLGWSVLFGYLIAAGTTYFAFLAGLPGAFCALLFIILGATLTLGICFVTYALFTGETEETVDLEGLSGGEIESVALDISKLFSETFEEISHQPAPNTLTLTLKRNSLNTLLDIVDRRLETMKQLGISDERGSLQLKSARDQLIATLSLTDPEEYSEENPGDTVKPNPSRRVA